MRGRARDLPRHGLVLPHDEVESSLDALRSRLRDSTRGQAAVLAPGDPEARSRAGAAGVVTTDSSVIHELTELGRRHVPREEATQ